MFPAWRTTLGLRTLLLNIKNDLFFSKTFCIFGLNIKPNKMAKLSKREVSFYKKFLTTKEYKSVAESVGFSQSMVSQLFAGSEIKTKHIILVNALRRKVEKNIRKIEKEIENYKNDLL